MRDKMSTAKRITGTLAIPVITAIILEVICFGNGQHTIEHVCRLKDIDPKKHPLSIVCADLSQASEYARIDNRAFAEVRANLPGKFTYILPTTPNLPKVFKGRREVGLRIPDNNIARELARQLGNPLMTSTVTWPEADDADTLLPESIALAVGHEVDYVVDAGESDGSLSTVIDMTDSSNPVVVRQ